MKNYVLAAAVALLALVLAVPASAGEAAAPASGTAEAAPAPEQAPGQGTDGWLEPIDLVSGRPLLCANVHGYACPTLGATTRCVDACGNSLSCTCVSYPGWKLWRCAIPC